MSQIGGFVLIACVLCLAGPAIAQSPGDDPGTAAPVESGDTAADSSATEAGTESGDAAAAAEDGASDETDDLGDILLDEGPSFLPEPGLEKYVSVSTKYTQTVEETPASVWVIDRAQLEAGGYRSVGEALAFAPGLYVSYDLLNYHVGVRGIFGGSRSGTRTLKVMINGRAATYVQSGTYLLGPEFMPISAIERIEIMRGPASALYGTGALEGAINIVTRRPPYEGEVTASGQIGLYGGSPSKFAAGADGYIAVTGERFFLLLAANGNYSDRSGLSLRDDSFFRENPRFSDMDGAPLESRDDIARPRSFFGRIEARVAGGRFDASAVGQFQDNTAEFHDLTAFSGAQQDVNTRVNIYNFNAGASYEKPFASGYAIRTRVGVSRAGPMNGDRFFVSNTTPVGLEPGNDLLYTREFSSSEYSFALELLREFGDFGLFLLGVDGAFGREELQHVTVTDVMTQSVTTRDKPPSELINGGAFFAQVLYPVNPKITLASGVRFDVSNIHDATVTGRAGSVFRPREDLFIKLMAGRAFKAPSPEQLYGSPITDGDFEGDDELPEQYINGLEANISYYVTPSLKASVTGFYNWHSNALSNLLRGGRLVATSFDSQTVGAEVALQHSKEYTPGVAADFSIMGSFQNTSTPTQTVAGITEKPVPDNEIYPRAMVTAIANLRLAPAKMNTHVAYRFVGERIPSQSNLLAAGTVVQDNPQYTLPAYNVLDVAVSSLPTKMGDLGQIVGTVKLENVFDARYSEIGFNGIDVPNLGRVFWIRARLDF